MKYEKSCGAVVFIRWDKEVRYIVVEQLNGVFGFPKGHVKEGETEEETAEREIYEETGLFVRLIKGFRTETEYPIRDGAAMKKVVCFLAESLPGLPERQEDEIKSIRIVPFDEAVELVTFEDTKRIFRDANAFLLPYLEFFDNL